MNAPVRSLGTWYSHTRPKHATIRPQPCRLRIPTAHSVGHIAEALQYSRRLQGAAEAYYMG